MSPADIIVQWPSAEEFARAVFAAAKAEDCDPIDVFNGEGSTRARVYAALALAHRFPTAPRTVIARKCGDTRALDNFRQMRRNGGGKWLSINRLNGVRAALGWPAMREDEIDDATRIYNGRSWQDFVDRTAELAPAPARVEACPSVDAGPAREKAPAVVSLEAADDLPLAPPPRVSPAAAALATAARAMRPLHPMARIIDRREPSGDVTAALMGDPTPEHKRRMAETPGRRFYSVREEA